jgi:hypothetical protein
MSFLMPGLGKQRQKPIAALGNNLLEAFPVGFLWLKVSPDTFSQSSL